MPLKLFSIIIIYIYIYIYIYNSICKRELDLYIFIYYISYDPLSGPGCISDGHTGCCVLNTTLQECKVNGGLCFCDMNCHMYNNCCSDIAETCPLGGEFRCIMCFIT